MLAVELLSFFLNQNGKCWTYGVLSVEMTFHICQNIEFLIIYFHHPDSTEMAYHRLNVSWKCSLSSLDWRGSMTTYGISNTAFDIAFRAFFFIIVWSLGWMNFNITIKHLLCCQRTSSLVATHPYRCDSLPSQCKGYGLLLGFPEPL